MLYSQFLTSKRFSNILLGIGIIVFLFIKIFYISTPYFWDESWVYGPALSEMGSTIPSLLPGSIDIDLSRGHPMLFHFLGGIWGNIFGISVTSLHVFALAISLILLFLYWNNIKAFLPNSTHFALLFLCFTGIFIAQSAMVLPEVLVSLFVLLSLFSFANQKHNKAILFASLCLLSKESGAILFPTLGLAYLFHQILTDTFSWKKSFIFLGKLILGLLPYIAFLCIQKLRFDWFFYPNHIDLQVNTVEKFQSQFRVAIKFILFNQTRILLSTAALAGFIYRFWGNRRALFLLGVSLIHFSIWAFFPMSTWTILFVYIFLSICSVAPFFMDLKKVYSSQHLIYLSILVFILLYCCFTAVNFMSARYLLCLLPLTIFISFKTLDPYFKHFAWHILSLLFVCISAVDGMKKKSIADVNMSFVDSGQAQKALIEYLEVNEYYDELIMAPFLVYESLKKINAGYRSTDTHFTKLPSALNTNEAFINIVSFQGENINEGHKENRERSVIKEFKCGEAFFILEKYSAKKK